MNERKSSAKPKLRLNVKRFIPKQHFRLMIYQTQLFLSISVKRVKIQKITQTNRCIQNHKEFLMEVWDFESKLIQIWNI